MTESANKIVLITGGARSGKSTYAQQMAALQGGKVLYCATAEALDDEMRTRIEVHKRSRPAGWDTLEAGNDVALKLKAKGAGYDVVLIDCITMLVANLLGAGQPPAEAEYRALAEVSALIDYMAARKSSYILVTNEVGFGIVPENPLARLYRDVLGRANQQLAGCADEVYLMTAGLPLKIK
jgi:adenosylcobinamide kinase / adenosylcobinamide-phosphate guanylyltransferase